MLYAVYEPKHDYQLWTGPVQKETTYTSGWDFVHHTLARPLETSPGDNTKLIQKKFVVQMS